MTRGEGSIKSSFVFEISKTYQTAFFGSELATYKIDPSFEIANPFGLVKSFDIKYIFPSKYLYTPLKSKSYNGSLSCFFRP